MLHFVEVEEARLDQVRSGEFDLRKKQIKIDKFNN